MSDRSPVEFGHASTSGRVSRLSSLKLAVAGVGRRQDRGSRRRWIGGGVALVAAGAAALAVAPAATADIVQNNIVNDTSGVVTVAPGGTATVGFLISATNTPTGDPTGCDSTGSNPATLTVNGLISGITASPSSLQIKGCDTFKNNDVTFSVSSSVSPGDVPITISVSGGVSGAKYINNAAFTLRVKSPNTSPTVKVSGPVNGQNYEKGSVPAASCNVSDAEDGSSTFAATLSAVGGPLAGYGLGSQTASCSYTDKGGLKADASVTYNIVDTTAPTLKTPGDQTVEATSGAGAVVSWTASATDAVDPAPVVSCLPASGGTFPLGTTLIQCTAKDEAGNTANGQFNVIVQDTTKPTLTLPSDITKEATGPSGAEVTYTATAQDTVDGPITPSCVPASGATFALGANPVNCTATDNSSNTAVGGFNVVIVDTTAPTITVPDDQVLEATGPDGAVLTYSATASDLVDGTDPVSCDSPSGTVFGLGSTTVTCSTQDKAGNPAFKSFKVTVRDTTAPKLTLPADITTEATKQAGADVSYSVSASDLVDGVVTPHCNPQNGTFAVGTTTVTCTATDNAGNTASGSFKVTVTDTTPPAFADVPADQTIEATGPNGAEATYIAPTATDLVDGPTTVSCDHPATDTYELGTTTVKCTSADSHGNAASVTFHVKVQDTTPPTVTVADNQTLEATGPHGAVATWSGVSAVDLVDGPVDATCDHGSGDTFPLGVTTVTCSATDAHGNTGEASFTVTVQDKTAPDVTAPSQGNQVLEATGPHGAPATWDAVTAYDLVDGVRPVSCDHNSGDTFAIGTTTVTCTATDESGNEGHAAFTIQVQDTTAPVVTVPADVTAEATGPDGAAVTFAASASDLVDGSVSTSCTRSSGATFPLGETSVTCSATDAHGNTGTASFTVKVVDTTAPELTVPGDKTVEATGPNGANFTYSASATDLVDGAIQPACAPASGSTFPLGTTTVKCSATDQHGNAATSSFKVTVRDTTAPSINELPNIRAVATSAAGAPVTFSATATDLVDGTVPATCTPPSGSTFALGVTTVNCTAKDAAGNLAGPVTFTVTVGFSATGFLAPVDGNKVLNGMKAGSTAPLKWQISDGRGGYISDLSVVSKMASAAVNCTSGATLDDLPLVATGATTLRYDTTANQYIYNWQSPKKAGTCYTVTVGLTDGQTISALFQLK